jgi:membrane-bound serine protease (ClpP class)
MVARIALGALAVGLLIAGPVIGPAPAQDAATGEESVLSDESPGEPAESAPDLFVHHLRWDDAITPVTRTVLKEALDDARDAGAAALVVELDTPGGLLDATRDIVTDILDSRVPVIVWVGPAGARAASAGTFITMAAHVAAMAPGTNIGAASPVTMGGGGVDSTMANKMFNDTAAFVRTIAERRGRNAEWAESAVRKAESITETEAVEIDVVDFVARDVEELLELSDGRVVETPDGEIPMAVAGARLVEHEIPFRYRVLAILVNPNVVYILMILGIYGLFFELQNPGAVFPGVIGAICLILGLYSMQTLPLNLAGILLMVLGGILFLLEIKVTSFGLLTLGGVVCTLLGGLMLFESPEPALRASLAVILPITLVTAAVFLLAVGLSVRTMRSQPTTGREGLIGEVGRARTALDPRGQVEVHGEIWTATVAGDSEPVQLGDEIEVLAIEGLHLTVGRRSPGARNT